MQVAERDGGHADVGGVLAAEERGLAHEGGGAERGVVEPDVEGGGDEQLPERLAGLPPLAVARQPGARADPVERRVGRVEAVQGQGGEGRAQPVGRGEQLVAGEGGQEVQRAGGLGAVEPPRGAVGGEHPDVEAVLDADAVQRVQPGQQPLVRRAALEEDVLPVVDGQAVPGEGVGGAAERGRAS